MTYWFCFPTLPSDPQWKRTGDIGRFNANESTALVERVGTWRYSVDNREYGFFLAKKVRGKEADALRSSLDDPDEPDIGFKWEVGSLRDFESGFFNDIPVPRMIPGPTYLTNYPERRPLSSPISNL